MVKVDEDKLFKLKARIASQNNNDSDKHEPRSDCFVCASTRACILEFILV